MTVQSDFSCKGMFFGILGYNLMVFKKASWSWKNRWSCY